MNNFFQRPWRITGAAALLFVVIGFVAIFGYAAVAENDPNGLFATINSVA